MTQIKKSAVSIETEHKNQGGAATLNPSRFYRWLLSQVMKRSSSAKSLEVKRRKHEKRRCKKNQKHQVAYFHQVDDPYSHLAVQALPALLDRYNIEITPYLVTGPSGDNAPEPSLLLNYARNDCAKIAPHYQLDFPLTAEKPKPEQVNLAVRAIATRLLADHKSSTATNPTELVLNFAHTAIAIGQSLWRSEEPILEPALCNETEAKAVASKGNNQQTQLGHYSGAMFYYAGEWYWGIDRLHHLEQRLIELNANKTNNETLVVPRPRIDAGKTKGTGKLSLEFYLSLRSPYSSLIYQRCVTLCKESGVNLTLRPVLPMVMRGASMTRTKGLYIFFDAGREARSLGLDWGNIADPIGKPVLQAYALFEWARQQNKEVALFGAFYNAAFCKGINTNTNKGMRKVIEDAGLDWNQAQAIFDNTGWGEAFEQNRLAMYGFQSWGVPSFRLLNEKGEELLGVWGQDRLWLVANKIKQLLVTNEA